MTLGDMGHAAGPVLNRWWGPGTLGTILIGFLTLVVTTYQYERSTRDETEKIHVESASNIATLKTTVERNSGAIAALQTLATDRHEVNERQHEDFMTRVATLAGKLEVLEKEHMEVETRIRQLEAERVLPSYDRVAPPHFTTTPP